MPQAQITASLHRAIVNGLGEDAVRTEPDDLAYYGADRCRGSWPVAPSMIVLPRAVEQVQTVVRLCAEHGAAIVPSGGRTGLAGAATATNGEVVLSLERMHDVLEIDVAARTLRCEAGATIEAVQVAAAGAGLLYPVDFAAKGSAQVGGSIATNAGGVRVLRYGSTRSWVAGLRVVVASGDVLEIGGSLVKDNTGYDLRQMFIGSEGTLGIIVEATLKLTSPPRGSKVALCAVPEDGKVLELFARVQGAMVLRAFECFDQGCLRHVLSHRHIDGPGPLATPSVQHVLLEAEVEGTGASADEDATMALAECLADAQEAGEITDAVLAGTPQQARDLWALREDTSESLHRFSPHKSDIAVPVARVTDFLKRWRALVYEHLPEAEAVVFGHIGDGNLHLNILRPHDLDPTRFLEQCRAFDAHTYGLVAQFGGSISAEHGIGLLKREHLHFTRSEGEVALMRAIKRAIDPHGMFNPGKVFA